MTSRLIIMLQYPRQHSIGTWIDQRTEQNWKISTQKSSQLSFVWQSCKHKTFPVLHCILTLFQPNLFPSPFTGFKTGLCLKFSSYSSSRTLLSFIDILPIYLLFLGFCFLEDLNWWQCLQLCCLVVDNHIFNIQLNKFLIL